MPHLHVLRRGIGWLGAVAVVAAIVPAVASARTVSLGHLRVHVPQTQPHRFRHRDGSRWQWNDRDFGATTLALDPSTAAALQSLGVTPAPIAPATAGANGLSFPISDSLARAAFTHRITHRGGISLAAGSTVVDLTNFWIDLGPSPTLSADVGGSRVTILDLDLSGARVGFGFGGLTLGPVTARLTSAAAGALNSAFGVSAFTPGLVLGTANIHYSLFGLF